MKYLFFLALVSIMISSLACSKKAKFVGQKYKLEEMKKLASEATELPKKIEEGGVVIPFSEYSPGVVVLESFALKYKRLVFFAVSFENEEMARNEAIRLNQYYVRNYLFDRTEGEPVLEDYVIRAFNAINPNRTVQRKPKQQPDLAAPSALPVPAEVHH